MNIAVKKVELIAWLTKIDDLSLLEQVDNLKKKSLADAYEANLKPMTSLEYKSQLDQAEEEYKNGRVTSQEDIEKESENW